VNVAITKYSCPLQGTNVPLSSTKTTGITPNSIVTDI
jgi:hypothetical protein